MNKVGKLNSLVNNLSLVNKLFQNGKTKTYVRVHINICETLSSGFIINYMFRNILSRA